jgi:serine/threonine-protein kinase PknK
VTVGQEGGTRMLPPGVHDSPDGYENLSRIGQGGSASVYRALNTRFDRIVALKILRSDSLSERQQRRFNAECLATGRVSSHPNIVTVYDAGITPGHRPWLAMEYCSGGSLGQKVSRDGPLPVAEVISIGARLCGALSAAHEAGILHRDVKPHNVLLTSYGEPALADFGIASVRIEEGAGGMIDTSAHTVAYTVVHAAPEILEGRAGTAAADIYSLGSTLYTLLAGQAPFANEAATGLAPLVTRILRNDLPVIARPGIPPELEQILRRSMAALPQDRHASAAELGDSLAGLARKLATDQMASGAIASTHSAAEPPSRPVGASPARATTEPPALPSDGSPTRSAGVASTRSAAPPAPTAVVAPISARRMLLILGTASGVLLTMFMASGFGFRGSGPDEIPPEVRTQTAAQTGSAGTAQAAERYSPRDVVVSPGHNGGELVVTWGMPIRPDVVATVVYEGVDRARARAVVTYNSAPPGVPQATLRGLPAGQRVCMSAAHVVSVGDKTTNAMSQPVCAVPR